MPAIQPNATTHNPNDLQLTQVATYRREVNVPIERVWENVLDWEHLPWLHDASFDYIAVIDAGAWGWRAWSDKAHVDHIELCVAGDNSYVARSYQSNAQVSEIWTHLVEKNQSTGVTVEFFLPDVPRSDVEKVGELMTGLYSRLWDEDEQMMLGRQARLAEVRDLATEVNLGSVAELRERLAGGEIITFQAARREYQLRIYNDDFIAHASICPHLLGPLTDSPIEGEGIRCPWHGYKFDLTTGECTSPAEATCRLSTPPTLKFRGEQLIASMNG